MNTTALILAAHGSRHEPSVNDQVRTLAGVVAARGSFDEVAVAFHQGRPPFDSVLDELTAQEIVVVPLMTSEGYYSDVVLPRELAKNRRFAAAGKGEFVMQLSNVPCPDKAKDSGHE
jgi:sirohydrochlorin cobaltochelatase